MPSFLPPAMAAAFGGEEKGGRKADEVNIALQDCDMHEAWLRLSLCAVEA